MSPVPFADRPLGSTLVLFGELQCPTAACTPAQRVASPASPCADVDETLTPTRQPAGTEILAVLKALREKAVIGFVGGSDLPKITEQLAVHGQNSKLQPSSCIGDWG